MFLNQIYTKQFTYTSKIPSKITVLIKHFSVHPPYFTMFFQPPVTVYIYIYMYKSIYFNFPMTSFSFHIPKPTNLATTLKMITLVFCFYTFIKIHADSLYFRFGK